MTRNIARRLPEDEKTALAGAVSRKVYDSRNGNQGSGLGAFDQAAHQRRAAEYQKAARRNAEAGRELGGKQGFALLSLAKHFSRRAHQHAVAAGGAR